MALLEPSTSSVEEQTAISTPNGKQTTNDGGDDGNKTTPPGRLPRWTRHDILVLIEAKRVVETQQTGRTPVGRNSGYGSSQLEPKWEAISSYCRRHGVNRTLAQCRKRWSNLGGDFRKVRDWEYRVRNGSESESYWVMRSDSKRDRKLPGHFEKEIYDLLVGKTGTELVAVTRDWKRKETEEEGDEEDDDAVLFDSGKNVGSDDGLFSEDEVEEVSPVKETRVGDSPQLLLASPLPLSEKRYEPSSGGDFNQGMGNEKQPGSYPERKTSSQEGRKRRRSPSDESEDVSLQDQLVKLLERNNRMLTAQLESQNINFHLDRDQRKHQNDGLINVLGKMVDALGKIAEKL